jgi:hypothetical protein
LDIDSGAERRCSKRAIPGYALLGRVHVRRPVKHHGIRTDHTHCGWN